MSFSLKIKKHENKKPSRARSVNFTLDGFFIFVLSFIGGKLIGKQMRQNTAAFQIDFELRLDKKFLDNFLSFL